MKLFRCSSGMIVSFGFDMFTRKPDPHGIWWNDPTSGEWEPATANMAGWHRFSPGIFVTPEFVRQCGTLVLAYQPGQCIEMTPIGSALIWQFRILRPDEVTTPFEPWAKHQRIEWPRPESLV